MKTDELEKPQAPKPAPDIDAMRFLLGRVKNAARLPTDNPDGLLEDLDERQQALEAELTTLLTDTDINSSAESQMLAFELHLAQFAMLEISLTEAANNQQSVFMVKSLLAAIKNGRCIIQLVEPSHYYAPDELRYKIKVSVESLELDTYDVMTVLLRGKRLESNESIEIKLEPFNIGRDIELLA